MLSCQSSSPHPVRDPYDEALVHQKVPPSREQIQAALAAGRITIVPSVATTTVRIADYLKP